MMFLEYIHIHTHKHMYIIKYYIYVNNNCLCLFVNSMQAMAILRIGKITLYLFWREWGSINCLPAS